MLNDAIRELITETNKNFSEMNYDVIDYLLDIIDIETGFSDFPVSACI